MQASCHLSLGQTLLLQIYSCKADRHTAQANVSIFLITRFHGVLINTIKPKMYSFKGESGSDFTFQLKLSKNRISFAIW